MPDRPAHLDRERGLLACGGNRDLYMQVSGLLADNLPGRLGSLRRALLADDLMTVGRLAHKHKGAYLAIGGQALAEAFANLDAAARVGDTHLAFTWLEQMPPLAEAFIAEIQTLD